MKNINKYIIEKFRINKDTEISSGHNDEYFPFELIDKQWEPGKQELYSLKINGTDIWQSTPMIPFRRNMMSIFKKCKYKDFLVSYTLNGKDKGYMGIGQFSKNGYVDWRLYIYTDDKDPKPEKYIQKDGYNIMQKKIGNANYLNSNLHPLIMSGKNYEVKHIYISWLDNYKCIAINLDLIEHQK